MPALADISIVIPLGPGERAWHGLLPALREHASACEIVLSAVGDDPQSLTWPDDGIAGPPRQPFSDVAVRGPAGRACQLNAGAAAANREWLWLLHADSRPDASTFDALRRAPDGDYLGYFDLGFHDSRGPVRLNVWGAWLRSRWLSLPFGDQGFLLRRALFDRLGRFDPNLSSGEDHALVWAARRARVPIQPLRATLFSSARKYEQHGWWRTTRQHALGTLSQAWRFARPRR